jgi:hypothetical protein
MVVLSVRDRFAAFRALRSWRVVIALACVTALLNLPMSELTLPSAAYERANRSKGQQEFLTVGEMKRVMRLPCNYVHDGFYIGGSNEVVNQVYQTIMKLDDDIIPVVIESGGHDGITKSLSLKASMCLQVNTMLIEASPSNYNVLKQTRKYDLTVNAALCEQDYVELEENQVNSGETCIFDGKASANKTTVQVPCTIKFVIHSRPSIDRNSS